MSKSILDLATEFSRECALVAAVDGRTPQDGSSLVSFKEMESNALKCHPSLRKQMIEEAKQRGVPTYFKPNGCPVFTSSRHFRAYCRVYGLTHRGY